MGRARPVGDPTLPSAEILGMRVDGTSYGDATQRVIGWARAASSRSVCVATVNNVMEGVDDPAFLGVMRRADLVTPDGMPLVWALRLLGLRRPSRVVGAELTPAVMRAAAEAGIKVGLFGSTPEVLADLRHVIARRFPQLEVSYAWSPPFRQLTLEEEERVVSEIVDADARILFVGLGCPKQEIWMDRMRGRIPAVMLGVGAAFDFLSGRRHRAPAIMQRTGLEWVYRLVLEPRRLWRRYLRQNPRFVVAFSRQLGRRWTAAGISTIRGRKDGR